MSAKQFNRAKRGESIGEHAPLIQELAERLERIGRRPGEELEAVVAFGEFDQRYGISDRGSWAAINEGDGNGILRGPWAFALPQQLGVKLQMEWMELLVDEGPCDFNEALPVPSLAPDVSLLRETDELEEYEEEESVVFWSCETDGVPSVALEMISVLRETDEMPSVECNVPLRENDMGANGACDNASSLHETDEVARVECDIFSPPRGTGEMTNVVRDNVPLLSEIDEGPSFEYTLVSPPSKTDGIDRVECANDDSVDFWSCETDGVPSVALEKVFVLRESDERPSVECNVHLRENDMEANGACDKASPLHETDDMARIE